MDKQHKANAAADHHPSGGTSPRRGPVPVLARCAWPVVAPEVADRIVARRTAGDPVSWITRDLHLTPGEVLEVLRYDGGADR